MQALIILGAGIFLAYANGANDNFKGVATLFGSGTTNYHRALAWATATTFCGSMTAVVLAGTLLQNFTGKGLVDDGLVANADYASAVALGAGLTVLLATRIGMPISTTHAVVGALVGAGLAAGSSIHLTQLSSGFFLPLLFSPLLAIVASLCVYPSFSTLRRSLGVTAETCFCVGNKILEVVPANNCCSLMERAEELSVKVGESVTCRQEYQGRLVGVEAKSLLDGLHYLSAGAVSFARGLNDTPKIAALFLVLPHLSGLGSTALVGVAIALGGMVHSRRIAETMGQRITSMNHGQGFTANLMTSLIVIGASRFGMPVSTTHVSCGSLFGIGAVTGQAHWKMIAKILLAWGTTLPVGALLGGITFLILQSLK